MGWFFLRFAAGEVYTYLLDFTINKIFLSYMIEILRQFVYDKSVLNMIPTVRDDKLGDYYV